MCVRPATRRLLVRPLGPPSAFPPPSAPAAMVRARVFSVLVPDGVQGVPAVPAVKVQVPESSGCRHCTEVSSIKHQDPNLLTKNPFYVLSVPVPPRPPKSIFKRGVFHAKDLGAWAELDDDVPITQVSGFKSTKLSQISPGSGRRTVSFADVPVQSPTPSRTALSSNADIFASLLFKVCYYADEFWSDADVEAEICEQPA